MNKSASRMFYLIGILCWIIGGLLLAYGLSATVVRPDGTITPHVHPTWTTVGGIVFFIGCVLSLIAWMGAIARMARFGRWIWFVCLIIFPGIGLLCYIFFGPRTPSRRMQGPQGPPMQMPPPAPSYGD